jgi:hypothetical protein
MENIENTEERGFLLSNGDYTVFYRRRSLMSDEWLDVIQQAASRGGRHFGAAGSDLFSPARSSLPSTGPAPSTRTSRCGRGLGSVQGLVCGYLMALTGALMILGDLLAVGVAAGVVVANGVTFDRAPRLTPDDTSKQVAPVAQIVRPISAW